jgi:GT2 family glycosyltransferase
VRAGLAQASGNIVAFLDDDVEPEPAWLEVSLRPFTDPAVACVGGRVVTPGGTGKVHRDVGRIRWYGKHIGNIGLVGGSEPVDVEGVMEGNSAWRTHILRTLEFDPRLDYDDASMYGLDLSLQAIERGLRVVYQPLAVVHNASAPRDPRLDRSDRAARAFTYSRNYSIIASRHFAGLKLAAFWAWWVLVGERGSYGLLTGLCDFALGRVRFRVVAASFRGKWAGARA